MISPHSTSEPPLVDDSQCPHCKRLVEVPAHWRGREVKCTHCSGAYVPAQLEAPKLQKLKAAETERKYGRLITAGVLIVTLIFGGFVIYGYETAKSWLSATSKGTSEPFTLDPIQKEGIMVAMQDYGAREADIRTESDGIKLVIIVDYGTSRDRAERMADSFVRMVMSFSNDDQPQMEIGESKYSYEVGVATPDGQLLLHGIKPYYASRIRW